MFRYKFFFEKFGLKIKNEPFLMAENIKFNEEVKGKLLYIHETYPVFITDLVNRLLVSTYILKFEYESSIFDQKAVDNWTIRWLLDFEVNKSRVEFAMSFDEFKRDFGFSYSSFELSNLMKKIELQRFQKASMSSFSMNVERSFFRPKINFLEKTVKSFLGIRSKGSYEELIDISKILSLNTNQRVLEVGPGKGNALRELIERKNKNLPHFTLVEKIQTKELIELEDNPKVKVYWNNILEDLGLEGSSYDMVIDVIAGLSYEKDFLKVFFKFMSLLKINGELNAVPPYAFFVVKGEILGFGEFVHRFISGVKVLNKGAIEKSKINPIAIKKVREGIFLKKVKLERIGIYHSTPPVFTYRVRVEK